MLIASCVILLTTLTGSPPPNSDLATGVNLVRLFNTVESQVRSSRGYETVEELQDSSSLDHLSGQPANSGISNMMRAINRHDLSNPIDGWNVRIYTSADRQHYLIRAESSAGEAIYSDERGLISTASLLK
jgi:hypothetical protein